MRETTHLYERSTGRGILKPIKEVTPEWNQTDLNWEELNRVIAKKIRKSFWKIEQPEDTAQYMCLALVVHLTGIAFYQKMQLVLGGIFFIFGLLAIGILFWVKSKMQQEKNQILRKSVRLNGQGIEIKGFLIQSLYINDLEFLIALDEKTYLICDREKEAIYELESGEIATQDRQLFGLASKYLFL
jgi:hypothetical protein